MPRPGRLDDDTMRTTVLIDATMLLRWKHLAPVGIVRLERLLAQRLRSSELLGPASYVVWEGGYRPATDDETVALDALLRSTDAPRPEHASAPALATSRTRSAKSGVKRAVRSGVERLPPTLRPYAEQAAMSAATLVVESSRYTRRRIQQRRAEPGRPASRAGGGVEHRVAFEPGMHLVAMGLGWEYIDHRAMYDLARHHGVRIHMPAFDLIPVDTPHLNWRQQSLVHRFYAEIAHYADSVTCISEATLAAMRAFYEREELPLPVLTANPLPVLPHRPSDATVRAPFRSEPFVLTVSTVEIRKNHILLAKLWWEMARSGRDVPHLVVVGKIGWDAEEFRVWVEHAPELDGRVHVLSDVDDDELVAMYDACLFTVFPSRAEGWGLPITESLGRGKVCVHSDDPAQLEASQGLMPSFHPDDFVGWRREIERLLDDPAHLASLEGSIRAGYGSRTQQEYCDQFEQMLLERAGGRS